MQVASGMAQTTDTAELPLVPAPAHATRMPGSLDVSHGLRFNQDKIPAKASGAVTYLQTLLAKTHTVALQQGPAIKATLVFGLRPGPAPGSSDEGYSLEVTPSGVRITASSPAGFLYGAVSLWQLLQCAHGTLATVTIEDEPRFRWRGLMLDSARHLQSEAFILQLLDYMAQHKLNVFHWHLTDDQGWRIEIKRYPRLTSIGAFRPQTMPPYQPNSIAPTGPYGGFFTQEQIRRIVAYAQARNIMVVPEIEMPGHASAVLAAYPQYGSSDVSLTATPVGWGIYPNLYNVNDATFKFLQNILLEVMDLFPGPYIHLGGDEAIKEQWKANPAVQAKMKALGLKSEDQLQSWFMQQIESFLSAHGRRVVGWDEILDGGLSPNATVMSWRGMEGGISAAKQGHDAVLTPKNPLYFNYRQSAAIDEPAGRDPLNTLADAYRFNPAPETLTPAEQHHILGVQASLWTEYVLTEERVAHMLFPRAAAVAEVGWSPASTKNYPNFLHRLPEDMERTRAFGFEPAESVFEVQDVVHPDDDGKAVTLALSTQGGLGDIHYTVDGSAVSTASPIFHQALQLRFPFTLRAQAFDGSTPLGSPVEHLVTLATSLRRDSRELDSCTNAAGIQMEQDPIRNQERPVFRAVFSKPCWLYRAADLSKVEGLSVGMGNIPFIFRTQTRPMGMPTPEHPEQAFLDVHLDSCAGNLLTSIPLAPAYHKDGVVSLHAPSFPAVPERHDLCLSVRNPDPNTVWLLNFIQPLPQQ
ncbi:MAG: beta-N-acetylhexosaminidase [Janthinobacterium lividum]